MRSFFAILVVIAIVGIVYVFVLPKLTPSIQPNVNQSETPSPVTENNTVSSPTNSIKNDLLAGGNSYRDPKGLFVFLYPNDYALDVQGEGQYTRISKIGATQQGQTEMYDGVIVVFERVDLNGQTLSTWLDDRIKTTTEDGTLEVIEPKKETILNNYPGFTYTMRGLGESENIVLQKDTNSNSAIVITHAVHDPENKNYQAEVDSIFETIELLK